MKKLFFDFLLLLAISLGACSVYGADSSYDWSAARAIVAYKDGSYYAVTKSLISANGQVMGKRVVVLDGKVYLPDNAKMSVAWNVYQYSGKVNKVSADLVEISSFAGKYLAYKSSTAFQFSTDKYDWILDDRGIKANLDETTRYIGYNDYYTYNNVKYPCFGVFTVSASYPIASICEFAGEDDGYMRSGLTNGKVGTICLDRASDMALTSGAKFYSVVGKRVDSDGRPTSLVLGEETGALEAGIPYIFVASDTLLAAAYSDDVKVTAAGSYHGLHGVLGDTYCVDGSANIYAVTGNMVKKAGAGSTVSANRAYIDMDEVPVVDSSSDVKGLIDFPLDGSYTAIRSIPSSLIPDLSSSVVPVTSHIYIKGGRKYLIR